MLKMGCAPDVSDEYGRTPMHWACRKGFADEVKLLLRYGANPNRPNSFGRTALHESFDYDGLSQEGIELLIRAGADVNAVDKNNETPLFLAAWRGNLTSVKLFMQHGANAKVRNSRNQTVCDFLGTEISEHPLTSGASPSLLEMRSGQEAVMLFLCQGEGK